MHGLINPNDTTERQRDKLIEICDALMRRVQQAPDDRSTAYVQFERAALLENQVRIRTADLERALDLLNQSNAQLAEANAAIEEARGNLNEALESMSEGFGLFDRNETLQLYNSRFCEDLPDVKDGLHPGLSFRTFVDRVSRSTFMDLPENTGPADWARKRLARHLDRRVVFNIGLIKDRWMQVGEHRTEDGGTVIVQTDVTAIMRERATLVDTQAKMLRATLDHLDQGVCIVDNNCRLVGWNYRLERMMQVAVPRVRVKMAFADIVDLFCERMQFSAGTNDAWLKAWASQGKGRLPITFELSDEGGQIFSVFAQEMPDRGFVVSFTDVTSQHRAAAALRDMNKTLEQRVASRTEELGAALDEAKRANESKTRFVAAASHDLLQPLSAAKLFAASLADSALDGEAGQISRKLVGALTSVEEIIEALLDISKLDVGQATFDIQEVSVRRMFASLSNELTPLARSKGLDLRVVETDTWVVSDAVFLRRILQNLITNAVRYTRAGRVLLGARRVGTRRLRLEVHDTGPGIRPEDQKRIFQEFARLTPSRSGAAGLGLGLAIVDRACQSLGHGLSLHSVPGRGSCFAVTVETAALQRDPPIGAPEYYSNPTPLAGKIVLLVENEADLASAIELRLEGWGAHAIVAANAEDAIDLLQEIDLVPDCMVLDYQLGPGMSGIELYCAINERYGRVPAMLISANRGAELRLGCELLGLPLLTKPLDPVTFLCRLEDLCAPAVIGL